MLIDEVKQKQPTVYRQWQEQPESICPPEGETIDHARERVETALSRLLKKHKTGVIGLVVPEPLASVVREHLSHEALGDLWQANCEHGRWTVIDSAGGATPQLAAPEKKPTPRKRKSRVEAETVNGHAATNGQSVAAGVPLVSQNPGA
jgi:broad specificity phosphatase PhoE